MFGDFTMAEDVCVSPSSDQVSILYTKAQSQSDAHRPLQPGRVTALQDEHSASHHACPRNEVVLSEIRITDRPSKRFPRDTL